MKMNSGHGGSQREMNPTNIKQKVGYIGLYEQILELGDDKHMLFQEGGDESLCMTPQERVATKISQYDGPQLKNKTKYELLGNIKISGVDISVMNGKRVVICRTFTVKIRSL